MSDSNVVDIGAMRIARVKEIQAPKPGDCPHLSISMEDRGDIVSCADCGKQLSAYWALKQFTEGYGRRMAAMNEEIARTVSERATVLHLKGAKLAETAWRKHDTVPNCPHCKRGIFHDDGFGHTNVSKLWEQGLRARERSEAQAGTRTTSLSPGKPQAPARAVKPRTKGKPMPRWENAPEWALWLTQNRKGHWYWRQCAPVLDTTLEDWHSVGRKEFAGSTASTGTCTKQCRPEGMEARSQ